jgi:hypothetical protein
LYTAIANAIVSESVKPGDPKPEFSTTTETINWYNSRLESLSERLAEPEETVHAGLIITFCGLACLDVSTPLDWWKWVCCLTDTKYSTGDLVCQDIHLQCLKKLVDDKGGIDKITNQNLRFLISWSVYPSPPRVKRKARDLLANSRLSFFQA